MKLSRLLRPFLSIKDQVFQVGVVACLATVGFWGHQNHWSISSTHAESPLPEAASPPAVLAASAAVGSPLLIHFPSAESAEELGIRSAPADRQHLVEEVDAAGVVAYEPARLAQLSARCAGTVWRVEKQVGQEVRAGDVLAIIDSAAVGQAKADFLHAIADVELRQKAYDRLKSLDNGEVPAKTIEESKTELRKARVDLFNAQQALISLGLPVDLQLWKNMSDIELQTKLKFLGLPEAIVSQFNPNATTASLLPIVAPFNGTVIGREMALGELVSPGQNRIEIADVSRMWIVLNIREQDADDLELGQAITFTAGSATVSSSISWISTAIDEKTRTVEVRCEADNPMITNDAGETTGKRLLRANLFGSAKVRLHEKASAFVVPTKAVQRYNGSHVIFVESDKQVFEARTVRTGIVTAELTEILEGLSESEPVVIQGSHILKAELQRAATAMPST